MTDFATELKECNDTLKVKEHLEFHTQQKYPSKMKTTLNCTFEMGESNGI
jgi:hypothetical protein